MITMLQMSYYNIIESKEKFVTWFLCLQYQLSTNYKEGSELMDLGKGKGTKEKEKENGKGEGGRWEKKHEGGSHSDNYSCSKIQCWEH